MKLDPNQEYGYLTWVGHPEAGYENDQTPEGELTRRRYEINILGGIEDSEASYDYDDWALCELDGKYYLLSTSGCSCPSPSETWGLQHGPATLAEIREHLKEGNYEGYTVPGKQMDEFMDLIDKVERGEVK